MDVVPQNCIDPEAPMSSPYTFVVSVSDNSVDGVESPLYLKHDLLALQADFNDILKREGHVFLNDILRRLERPGDPNSVHPYDAGQIVGWRYIEGGNPNGNNYIDFGILSAKNLDFLNGNRDFCILDFNVDGPILGKGCFR